MKKLIIDKLPRIKKARAQLEKKLGVKISNRGKEVFIEGSPENEYIAEKVIIALDFGFPFSSAIQIMEEDYELEILNIKEFTKQKNLERIRGRIIGKQGKTLKTISSLSECDFELKDNQMGIIGNPENIKNAREAAISLIRGSKQANVYSYLEKHHIKPIYDLGLKEVKKKK